MPEQSELPKNWGLFQVMGVSVPVPIGEAKRTVLIVQDDQALNLYVQNKESKIIWAVDFTNNFDRHHAVDKPVEELLKNAISEPAISDRVPTSNAKCLEEVIGLLTLDLFSAEYSNVAADLGWGLFIQDSGPSRNRWQLFWRNRHNRIVYAYWQNSDGLPGIVANLQIDSKPADNSHPFQKLLSCIEADSVSECGDLGVPGLEIVTSEELFGGPAHD